VPCVWNIVRVIKSEKRLYLGTYRRCMQGSHSCTAILARTSTPSGSSGSFGTFEVRIRRSSDIVCPHWCHGAHLYEGYVNEHEAYPADEESIDVTRSAAIGESDVCEAVICISGDARLFRVNSDLRKLDLPGAHHNCQKLNMNMKRKPLFDSCTLPMRYMSARSAAFPCFLSATSLNSSANKVSTSCVSFLLEVMAMDE
jgi:hypothetical protein